MLSSTEHVWETMMAVGDKEKARRYSARVNDILNESMSGRTKSMRGPRVRAWQKGATANHAIIAPTTVAIESSAPGFGTLQDAHFYWEAALSPAHLNTLSAEDISSTLLASWVKNKNAAADGDLEIRKEALRCLSQDLCNVAERFQDFNERNVNSSTKSSVNLEDIMSILMDNLARTLFKALADPSEACR